MKHCFRLLAVLTFLTAASCPAGDAEWQRMEEQLVAASSQSAMNRISGDMAEYIDDKLEAVESQVLGELDEQSTRLFRAAAEVWRDYRAAQSKFEGDLFRDGSVHPLIRNRAYIRLTQERIAGLSNLDED